MLTRKFSNISDKKIHLVQKKESPMSGDTELS